MRALAGRTAGERAANGGLAARRAVLRWGWRLFRRDWRQQLLVLVLLAVAVAAAAFSVIVRERRRASATAWLTSA